MTGYLHRIRDAVRVGSIPTAAVVSVDVQHAMGCPRKPCHCHPRITVQAGDQVLVIGTRGAVLERSKRQ